MTKFRMIWLCFDILKFILAALCVTNKFIGWKHSIAKLTKNLGGNWVSDWGVTSSSAGIFHPYFARASFVFLFSAYTFVHEGRQRHIVSIFDLRCWISVIVFLRSKRSKRKLIDGLFRYEFAIVCSHFLAEGIREKCWIWKRMSWVRSTLFLLN